jgi:Excreted virulence factor EspC, type VII ESX diderm
MPIETGCAVGYEVDPDALRSASGKFCDSSDAVGDAAALLGLTQLVPQALGEVAAADEFSAAVSRFAGTHDEDLRHGSVWVNDAADGLVSNADAYQRHDDAAADTLRRIGPAR